MGNVSKKPPKPQKSPEADYPAILTFGASGAGKSTFCSHAQLLATGTLPNSADAAKYILYNMMRHLWRFLDWTRTSYQTNAAMGQQELANSKADTPLPKRVELALKLVQEWNDQYNGGPDQESAARAFAVCKKLVRKYLEATANYQPGDPPLINAEDWRIRDVAFGASYAPQALHILNSYDRIFAPNYVPTNDDLLAMWNRTTGLIVTFLQNFHESSYSLLELGGRGARRKAAHHFVLADMLLFFSDIASYDGRLIYDDTSYAFEEEFAMFTEIASSKHLADVPFYILLTKTDLLEARLRTKSFNIKIPFPEYDGTGEYDSVLQHATKKIDEFARSKCNAVDAPSTRFRGVLTVNCLDSASIEAVLKTISAELPVTPRRVLVEQEKANSTAPQQKVK